MKQVVLAVYGSVPGLMTEEQAKRFAIESEGRHLVSALRDEQGVTQIENDYVCQEKIQVLKAYLEGSPMQGKVIGECCISGYPEWRKVKVS